ncbi:MAG: MBL fold metallo-hydrolase [Eubacteriaceae bacterium]|nr:MBL fold metallo-hydrolase [Eubacteriaceae bacterium]
MKIMHVPLGALGTNCYIFHDGQKAAMVDIGIYSDKLIDLLDDNGLSLEYILLTHGHFDHTTGVQKLKEKTGAKVGILSEDGEMLGNAALNGAASFGMEYDDIITADILFSDGDEIAFGGDKIKIIATPGHTRGGCCYLLENEKVLFAGDTLFRQSIGRTDLYGGDMDTLITSIKEKLMVLDDEVFVCPGHGMMTNIAYERENNPFVR